jgi:hypothetical protein
VIDQLVIVVCGTTSIWLSQSPTLRWRRMAPWIGLAGQPAWMWATWHAEQWGIFALSFVYAAGWIRGIHTYWWPR